MKQSKKIFLTLAAGLALIAIPFVIHAVEVAGVQYQSWPSPILANGVLVVSGEGGNGYVGTVANPVPILRVTSATITRAVIGTVSSTTSTASLTASGLLAAGTSVTAGTTVVAGTAFTTSGTLNMGSGMTHVTGFKTGTVAFAGDTAKTVTVPAAVTGYSVIAQFRTNSTSTYVKTSAIASTTLTITANAATTGTCQYTIVYN